MFGLGEVNSRFLYQQKPSYSPGDVADADGNVLRKSDEVAIEDGKGPIRDSECDKEVKTPWDTNSQNKLLNALATEIKKGGEVDMIIAKAGNTIGQIAFGMEKAGKATDINWGTKVQYLNADLTPAGDPMPLSEANALKPEWKVRLRQVDGKTQVEVIMDTGTTQKQLDALKNKVTKNIECDKTGKKVKKEEVKKDIKKDKEIKEEIEEKVEAKIEEVIPEGMDQNERKRKERQLVETVVNSVLDARKNGAEGVGAIKDVHWKLLDQRVGQYRNREANPLFVQVEEGINAVVTNSTLGGSKLLFGKTINGIDRRNIPVISKEKLEEFGVSQEEAYDIMNNDVIESEYRQIFRQIQAKKRLEKLEAQGMTKAAEKFKERNKDLLEIEPTQTIMEEKTKEKKQEMPGIVADKDTTPNDLIGKKDVSKEDEPISVKTEKELEPKLNTADENTTASDLIGKKDEELTVSKKNFELAGLGVVETDEEVKFLYIMIKKVYNDFKKKSDVVAPFFVKDDHNLYFKKAEGELETVQKFEDLKLQVPSWFEQYKNQKEGMSAIADYFNSYVPSKVNDASCWQKEVSTEFEKKSEMSESDEKRKRNDELLETSDNDISRVMYTSNLLEKAKKDGLPEERKEVLIREAMRAVAWGDDYEKFTKNTEKTASGHGVGLVRITLDKEDPTKISAEYDGKKYLFSQDELSGEWAPKENEFDMM